MRKETKKQNELFDKETLEMFESINRKSEELRKLNKLKREEKKRELLKKQRKQEKIIKALVIGIFVLITIISVTIATNNQIKKSHTTEYCITRNN